VIFTDAQNKRIYITSKDFSEMNQVQVEFRPDHLYLNSKQNILLGVEDNIKSKTVSFIKNTHTDQVSVFFSRHLNFLIKKVMFSTDLGQTWSLLATDLTTLPNW
jgi:hypothetical protein